MKTTLKLLAAALTGLMLAGAPALYAGDEAGTQNPCAAKANPCNPCAAKANPCNPCAAKANPCAAKSSTSTHKKSTHKHAASNPCNPCAAKNPCAGKKE